MSKVAGDTIASLFFIIFGLGWFAYHLRRFAKWQGRRATAPVRYWLITAYSVGCMLFGIVAAIFGATMGLQGT